jgi:hypothetical protein
MPVNVISGRLVLRKNVDTKLINPIEESIFRKLKVNEYKHSCLTVEEQNSICTIIENTIAIDNVKYLLKPIGLGNSYDTNRFKSKLALTAYENMFKILAQLTEHRVEVDFDLGERICTFWNNSIINKEFSKIRIDENSKTFICAAAAITYTVYFKTNSVERLEKMIEIIIDTSSRLQTFTFVKGNIFSILVGKILFNKKFDPLFEVQNVVQFRQKYLYKPSKHEKVFTTKFKKHFLETFFRDNEKKGEELFENYKYPLSRWFDSISAEFNTDKPFRETCGLKLIGNNKNMNPLLKEYFLFLTMQKTNVLPTDLTKEGWWSSFVDKIRYSYGYTDFWKLKIKSQVDKG